MARGPGNWISTEDTWYLREGYGQTRSCVNLSMLAMAAQLRVAYCEKWRDHGAPLATRAYRLSNLLSSTDSVRRRFFWRDWYARSCILLLHRNKERLEELKISFAKIECCIVPVADGSLEDAEKQRRKIKKSFQRTAYAMLKEQYQPNFVYRVREKIDRWNLEGVEAAVAATVHGNLNRLRPLVAPRVQSACLSTIWNRWTTPRRFQNRASPRNICLLGCGGQAEDSIEHYSRCRVVREVADCFLRLGRDITVDLEHFVLAPNDFRGSDDLLSCVAVLIYATYNLTNLLRAKDEGPVSKQVAHKLLKQGCRNAVMGHSDSTTLLPYRWCARDVVRRRRA